MIFAGIIKETISNACARFGRIWLIFGHFGGKKRKIIQTTIKQAVIMPEKNVLAHITPYDRYYQCLKY